MTVTTQGVILYTNWQAVTQCLIVCLTSEVLRPNIPYTKWRGLLNHLSSLVLWHSAASVGTRSKKELVNWLECCKWTRAFRSSSKSSNTCPCVSSEVCTVALSQVCAEIIGKAWKHTFSTICNKGELSFSRVGFFAWFDWRLQHIYIHGDLFDLSLSTFDFLFVVLSHSAALGPTGSQMKVLVYLEGLYEWTRTLRSSSESSQFCPTS